MTSHIIETLQQVYNYTFAVLHCATSFFWARELVTAMISRKPMKTHETN